MSYRVSYYQIILTAIATAFLCSAIARFIKKARKQTIIKLLGTVSIWGTVALFSLFPWLPHSISGHLGFGENLNTLIFVGFVVILMIVFKLLTIIERLDRDISEIVRQEALKKIINGQPE